jgi:hypothetical protein
MTKLLRNRWLHRALFVGVLIALGVGIYHFEPPEPMCEIDADNLIPRAVADGGRRFVTLPAFERPTHHHVDHPRPESLVHKGPLQIWDTRSGAEVGRHLQVDQMVLPKFSANGRHCAVQVASRAAGENAPFIFTLHLIDLAEGTAVEVPLDDQQHSEISFTPSGAVLTRLIDLAEGRELQLYDGATGRLLAERVSTNLTLRKLTEESVVYHAHTPGVALEIWSVPEHRLV